MRDFKIKKNISFLVFLLLVLITSLPAQKPEIVIQRGHSEGVTALGYSYDGRILASGSSNGEIILWEAKTGFQIGSSISNYSKIASIYFSDDNKFVTSIEIDNLTLMEFLVIRNVSDLQIVFKQRLERNRNNNTLSSLSPDGKSVVDYRKELLNFRDLIGKLVLIDVATRQEKVILKTPLSYTSALPFHLVMFTPDSQTIIAIQNDRKVRFWKVETLEEIASPILELNDAETIAYSQNNKFLAFGKEKSIKIWDIENNKLHQTIEVKEPLDSVHFSPSGEFLAHRTRNNKNTRIWNTATLMELTGLGKLSAFAFSSDSKIIAVNNGVGINLISPSDSKNTKTLKKLALLPKSVSFSPDGEFLAINYWERRTDVLKTNDLTRFKNLGGQNCAFSPNSKILAIGEANYTILINLDSGDELHRFKEDGLFFSRVTFSPNGNILAGSSEDGRIAVWDLRKMSRLFFLKSLSKSDSMITFSPKGNFLISWSKTAAEMSIWRMTDGKKLGGKNRGLSEAFGIVFSPDESKVAILSEGGVEPTYIEIWDWQKGEINTLPNFGEDPDWIKEGWHGDDSITSAIINSKLVKASINKNEIIIEGSSYITFGEEDWLVTTPDGFFDGTPNAQKQILWRLNNNTFDVVPVEAFYYEYFYPGLLKKILAGEKPQLPKNVKPFEQKDIRQPKVQIFDGKCSEQKEKSEKDKPIATTSIETDLCLEITASPNFSVQDFRDIKTLTSRLVAGKDKVSKLLFSKFLSDNQKRLQNSGNLSVENLSVLEQIVRQEFNSFIRDSKFYENNKNVLNNYTNSPEILELLKEIEESKEFNQATLLREILNRKLLEAIYLNELKILEVDSSKEFNKQNPFSQSQLQSKECQPNEPCLQDMRLFWNNRLMQRWFGNVAKYCERVNFYRLRCKTTVPLVKGENKYSAYLFNQDRVKSLDAEISINRNQ